MDVSLLIVDDEEKVLTSLMDYFVREGFKVRGANSGEAALLAVQADCPDIMILDVQLGDKNGLEVCKQARQLVNQPIGIIMISGVYREMVDRVVGLEVGADVYMTKPFETRELLAQVRALLRILQTARTPKHDETKPKWFIIDEYLRIDFGGQIVDIGGKLVSLTALEFKLLEYLVKHSGKAIPRSDLIDEVWGYEAGGSIMDGAVNTCISKLRKEIEPDPAHPRYIISVHGFGYKFKSLD